MWHAVTAVSHGPFTGPLEVGILVPPMDLLIAGFVGVLLGAAASAGTALLLLGRAADRDLIERRLRALISYREIVGAPRTDMEFDDPRELEQLLHDFEAFAREFRLTAWVFDESLRMMLARSVLALEEEVRRARSRGENPSPVAIVAAHRQLDLVLRSAAARSIDQFRRWKAWPFPRSASAGEDEDSVNPSPAPSMGEDVRSLR
jgi:hypothetical protein